MARLLRLKDLLEMDGQSPLQQKPLSFDDLHQTEYRPGEDELTNYRAYRRRKFGVGTGEGGPIGESTELEFDEALNMQQRMARKRQIKRFKSKVPIQILNMTSAPVHNKRSTYTIIYPCFFSYKNIILV